MDDVDRQLLEFELADRQGVGKQELVRETFSIGWVTYWQNINRILDDPDALEAYPMDVKRILNLRARLVRARAGRTF